MIVMMTLLKTDDHTSRMQHSRHGDESFHNLKRRRTHCCIVICHHILMTALEIFVRSIEMCDI